MSYKRSIKGTEIQQFMCRDTANVEHEIYDHTGNNWRHRNSNIRFEEKFGGHARKTFDMVITKNSCTWSITHKTESAAV
jgi:hypothetical protein